MRALPFFCCLEQLALAGDVTAVALGRDVLALGLHGLAGDDLGADRRLDRHVEQLARDQLLQPFDHLLAVGVGLVAVHDRAERVDRLAVQQDVDANQVRLLVAPRFVVEARVALRARLQLIEEVEHDLGQRQHVVDLDAFGRDVAHVDHLAAAALARLHHGAEVVGRRDHRGVDHRLLDRVVRAGRRHLRRVVHDLHLVAAVHAELDVRRGRDQLQVELALQPLLHDVHVQQPEEPAAEPEPQRGGHLGFVVQGGVGQLQPVEGFAQLGVVAAFGREQARPHHRLRLAVAGELLGGAALAGERDRVAHLGLVHVLEAGDEVAHLARAELVDGRGLGRVDAGLLGLGLHAGREHLDASVRRELALLDPDVGDHAAVGVEHRVEDQRLQRLRGVAHRRRHPVDHGREQRVDTGAGLRADVQDVVGIAVEQRGEFLRALLGLGRGQVDLVERRHDDQSGVARQVVVRERLGLQALGGVDQQHRALTGCERTRDLVGEVDVAGRVDQVELVALVRQAHRLRLDRDAALALQVHLVQVLGPHVAALDRVGDLQQAVGQRRFPVVDVRHDAEVADVGGVGGHDRPWYGPEACGNPVAGSGRSSRW